MQLMCYKFFGFTDNLCVLFYLQCLTTLNGIHFLTPLYISLYYLYCIWDFLCTKRFWSFKNILHLILPIGDGWGRMVESSCITCLL